RAPRGIPIQDSLQHKKALVQLHPEETEGHSRICEWMDKQHARLREKHKALSRSPISRTREQGSSNRAITLVDLPEAHQLDYEYRTRRQIKRAKKLEAELLECYRRWLKQQGRRLSIASY